MHVWGKCCLVNIKIYYTHICLHVAWWHLCAPRRKSITFQTAALHVMWLILQNTEQQQTGESQFGLLSCSRRCCKLCKPKSYLSYEALNRHH